MSVNDTEEALFARFARISPENAERALREARHHAETTLNGTMDQYLRWCLVRVAEGSPMPWDDRDLEIRREVNIVCARGEFGMVFDNDSLILIGNAMRKAELHVRRFCDAWSSPSLRLRRQSWQRRRHGRAIK